jgi:methionyl aminopeptidase
MAIPAGCIPSATFKRAAERLIEITYESADARHQAAVQARRLVPARSARRSRRYAEAERCSVVRDFCGHGVGQLFHDSPNILHYGRPNEGRRSCKRRHDLHHRADDQPRQGRM